MKKTLMVRKPLPPFTEAALKARCPLCRYLPPIERWQLVKASFDSLQEVGFLLVTCLRCGASVERYGAARP
jgi:hypothetical protein